MNDFEKEEFWRALGRLYDASANLVIATERLAETATAHEKRLDRAEVLLDALREEIQKLRGRPQ